MVDISFQGTGGTGLALRSQLLLQSENGTINLEGIGGSSPDCNEITQLTLTQEF